MNEKAYSYFVNSFLKPILDNEGITDITYNGENIFCQHNRRGRFKSEIFVTQAIVLDFIRQLANLTEQLFSYSSPILDVSVGKYRINAVHPAIGRKNYDKAVTFSIRIGTSSCQILTNDATFMDDEVRELLLALLCLNQSIIIAGKTGTGKTELQKYLIAGMEANSRIIVIDNVLELESTAKNADLDITLWQMSERINDAQFGELIRNGLRSNPDWLIVAESRGKEMLDVLNAAMTGHPVITTIHSQDLHSIPSRLTRMALMADEHLRYEEVYQDVISHFSFLVYLEKTLSPEKTIIRRVKSIGQLCPESPNHISVVFDCGADGNRYGTLLPRTLAQLADYGFDLKRIPRFALGG